MVLALSCGACSSPAAGGHAAVGSFHAAFWVVFVVAALGAVTAAIAFPGGGTRGTAPRTGPVPGSARPATVGRDCLRTE
jgi:hypothetical protein